VPFELGLEVLRRVDLVSALRSKIAPAPLATAGGATPGGYPDARSD
jgi:hypothetical protein